VKEFIDYAKTNPGQISFASSGVGASPHLSGEYFKFLTKIDMVHVPYRGSAAAYPDLMSGKVQVLFDNLGGPVLQMVHAGTLRALGVTSGERWPLLSDVPAIAETVPGYEIYVWYALFAPRGTPADIVTKLNAALKDAVADPKILARFKDDGGVPMVMTAHILLPQIDSENAASLSRAMLDGVLRRRLRFDGVILADDLGMGAIAKRYGPGEASVRTLHAGTDVAMLCHDWRAVAPAIDAVRSARQEGRFDEKEWRASLERIERACAQTETLGPRPSINILGCKEHRQLANGIRARLR